MNGLKLLVSRPVLLFVGLTGWALAVGMATRSCWRPPAPSGPASVATESTRTEPARDARKWPEESTAPPPEIRVLRPPAGQRSKIAARIDRPDLVREVTPETIEAQRVLGVITQEQADAMLASYIDEQNRLASQVRTLKDRILQFERELVARREVPASPWGGTATATTSRVTGTTDIDVERNPRPRVDWLWDFGVAASYALSDATLSGLAGSPATETMGAGLFAEPVAFGRTYPTILRFDAGWERRTTGDLQLDGWLVRISMETHFNRDRRYRRR